MVSSTVLRDSGIPFIICGYLFRAFQFELKQGKDNGCVNQKDVVALILHERLDDVAEKH